jgi:predicted nucleotidyltransferase
VVNLAGNKIKETPMTLEDIKKIAAPACHEFRVKRLDIFGSLARDTGSSESDVDLLVEFEEPDLQPSKRFFGLLHYLEDALGREIDLLTMNSLKNPFFRKRVLKEKVNLYVG